MTARRRMTNEEIKMHLQHLGLCIWILKDIPTGDLLQEFSRNDALGPVLDPTNWMAFHDTVVKNEQVVRALGVFMAEVRQAWPEIDNDEPTT